MAMWELQALPGTEAQQRLQETQVAILPMGAVEFHGAHLPVGTDSYIAAAVARRVAQSLDAVVLPLLPYGQVWSLYGFPGTLSVDNAALTGLICGIGRSLRQMGIPILALINAHLGNTVAMKEAARILHDEGGPITYCFTHPGMSEAAERVRESPRFHGQLFHACELETSLMLHLAPEHVDMSKAVRDVAHLPSDFDYRPVHWSEITQTGVLGDATLATADKGKTLIDPTVALMVSVLREAQSRQPAPMTGYGRERPDD